MRGANPMLNILLITADDMDGRTPGCFGGPSGVTPALDQLAAEGMRFERSHVPIAVCQPSRSAIMTSRWPHRNGAEGFEPIDDGVPLLTDVLDEAGYVRGILGKVDHIQPIDRFGWSFVRGMRELGMGRSPQMYGEAAGRFIAEATDAGRPWFLMANAHDPHRPFAGSAQEREKWDEIARSAYPSPRDDYEVEGFVVPGFLPDLDLVREEYAQYLASSRRCDQVVESVLAAVDAAGARHSTLVVFLSDNGAAFPFAKANCYLRSTLTPLIIRWPGETPPGRVERDAFVSMLDLLPTFCEVAGLRAPDGIDGESLVPLLRGAGVTEGRDETFSVFHETSAKRRYEMRCRQDADTGYIWNAWADGRSEYRAENQEGLTWGAMVEAARADAELQARTDFYRLRAAEELYDLAEDPDCLRNIVAEPEAAQRLARSRRRLGEWMESTGDPLAARYRESIGSA